MSTFTNDREHIHELKGNVEALTALLFAIVEIMPTEQRDLLPEVFYEHAELMRESALGSESIRSAFEDRFTKIKTTLDFPDTYRAPQ